MDGFMCTISVHILSFELMRVLFCFYCGEGIWINTCIHLLCFECVNDFLYHIDMFMVSILHWFVGFWMYLRPIAFDRSCLGTENWNTVLR